LTKATRVLNFVGRNIYGCSVEDVDNDSDGQMIRSLWSVDMEKNGKDQLAW